MRNVFTRTFLVLLAAVAGRDAQAQTDPHFSQYYVYPSYLNPALTGVFDGEYRVSGIYRSQWGSVSDAFNTIGVSGELNTSKNFSVGVNMFHQNAGTGGYYYTTGAATLSYHGVRFGPQGNHRIAMAIQGGVLNRGFKTSKITLGDTYGGSAGGPAQGSTDPLLASKLSSTSPDFSAGVLYYDATPGKKANIYAGFSASHLTRPSDHFADGSDVRVPMRFNVHGGVRFVLSDQVTITPNLLYMRQGDAEEKMAGAYMQLKASQEADVMIGANYRFKDSFSPYAGFYYKNMVLGVSYDVNTSQLSKVAGGSGGFEISLSFTGRKKPKDQPYEFVCPRL